MRRVWVWALLATSLFVNLWLGYRQVRAEARTRAALASRVQNILWHWGYLANLNSQHVAGLLVIPGGKVQLYESVDQLSYLSRVYRPTASRYGAPARVARKLSRLWLLMNRYRARSTEAVFGQSRPTAAELQWVDDMAGVLAAGRPGDLQWDVAQPDWEALERLRDQLPDEWYYRVD